MTLMTDTPGLSTELFRDVRRGTSPSPHARMEVGHAVHQGMIRAATEGSSSAVNSGVAPTDLMRAEALRAADERVRLSLARLVDSVRLVAADEKDRWVTAGRNGWRTLWTAEMTLMMALAFSVGVLMGRRRT